MVEVLLALALSGVLIASVLSALEMYRQLSTAGRRDVERSRLLRAIVDRIADDVRSVAFTPTEPVVEDEDSTGGAAEESVTEEASTEVTVTDPTDAYSGGSLGLVGSETALVLHTSRPGRTESYGDLATAVASPDVRASDLRSVSYFLAVAGEAGLPGAVADRVSSTRDETRDPGEPAGLVRMEGDRLVMTLADEMADLDALASGAEVLAPEVVALRFRYFDGTTWLTEWDASAFNQLPRAVEIAIALRIDADRPDDEAADSADEPVPPTEHRHVVWLPLSDPSPVEEVLP